MEYHAILNVTDKINEYQNIYQTAQMCWYKLTFKKYLHLQDYTILTNKTDSDCFM